jgi:hypothetical protein
VSPPLPVIIPIASKQLVQNATRLRRAESIALVRTREKIKNVDFIRIMLFRLCCQVEAIVGVFSPIIDRIVPVLRRGLKSSSVKDEQFWGRDKR